MTMNPNAMQILIAIDRAALLSVTGGQTTIQELPITLPRKDSLHYWDKLQTHPTRTWPDLLEELSKEFPRGPQDQRGSMLHCRQRRSDAPLCLLYPPIPADK
jgi:hypothetical protein